MYKNPIATANKANRSTFLFKMNVNGAALGALPLSKPATN